MRQRVIVVGQNIFEQSSFILHPSCFLERLLPESLGCSCLMETSSRHPARGTGSLCPSSEIRAIQKSDREGKSIFLPTDMPRSQRSCGKKARSIVQNRPIS